MPRQWTAMKDVAGCDKLRGGAEQPLIRRSPNGETLLAEMASNRYAARHSEVNLAK